MKNPRFVILISATLVLLFSPHAVRAVEFYDHPDIGRYERSTVIHQEAGALAEYVLGLGPARDGKIAETRRLTGKVLMTLYAGPENASSFEIENAYRELLRSKGFEILFSCSKSECGEKFTGAFYGLAPFASDYGFNNSAPVTQGNPAFSYVLVARSGAGDSQVYVSLIVSQGWFKYPVYKLDVIETGARAGKISSVAGKPGSPPSGSGAMDGTEPRSGSFGVQLSSDGFFGLLLLSNRLELCAKVQAVQYAGFPGGVKPDNDILMTGTHAAWLFRLSPQLDMGIGLDFRYGITTSGAIEYKQYIDAGPRIGLNYHVTERLVVSGVLYPAWVVVRETDVADSFSLTAQIPLAAVAVSFLF